MVQSPEYPDLRWVPPVSWTDANRGSVQLIVMHTTEGSSHAGSAEDGAAYDARRTDGTSTHYFHDSDSTVQCVRTADQAHTARAQGNRRGIHHELCGRAGSQDWASPYSKAMLARAAKQAARDAKKWGIPVRHLTVAEVAAGAKGFCAHYDITRAFPQDGGTHTDPGPNFPWSYFLDLVRAELNGAEVIEQSDIDKLAAEVVSRLDTAGLRNGRTLGGTLDALAVAVGAEQERDKAEAVRDAALAKSLTDMRSSLSSTLTQLAARDDVDEQALANALAPAVGAYVVASLPTGADAVSQDEVTTAVKTALRDAFATSTS